MQKTQGRTAPYPRFKTKRLYSKQKLKLHTTLPNVPVTTMRCSVQKKRLHNNAVGCSIASIQTAQ
ncbi:MAG TPA: hypothetical protein PL009_14395 [Flavipsychrobacter sp.]|nr:hypothetical protein [Flavipsychrobacter sp.]